MDTALIRVSRKRSADPRDALLINYKRAKQANPLVFTLFKAAAGENDKELEGLRVVDIPSVAEQPEEHEDTNNPLGFVQDEAVGLVGEVEQQKKRGEQSDQVSLNGRLLHPVSGAPVPPAQEEVVFDYYRIHEKRTVDWEREMDVDGLDVRFANRDELNLGADDDEDSDGPPADDDDDSNDEDNWRNDYPDEDSYDEDSDHDDPYGELVAENWHGGAYPEDNLHRRLENIAINDRYEAYFEGEDTDDEADVN